MLVLSINSNAQVPNFIPTNGLVSWYPFNGNANDESGNGHNGVVFNATLDYDRDGNQNSAYRFGNYNSYIATDTSNTMFYTFSGWVKNFNQSDTSIFIVKNTGWLNGHGYCHEFWNEYLDGTHMQTAPNSQCQYFKDVTAYSPVSTWHFVVFTYDGSMIRAYVDSIQIDSTSCSIDTRNPEIKYIGGMPNIDFGGFNGLIDDIGIWNRALSQTEIMGIYNSQLLTSTIIKSKPPKSIYPNPATDKIVINEGNKVYLVNLLGQIILTESITKEANTIYLPKQKGVYLIRVADLNNKIIYSDKLIIE